MNHNIKLITLVGMMGSGKTSCGIVLAKKLGISFVDIDRFIELEEDLKISQIFYNFGEEYFRLIEEKIIFNKINEYLRQNIKAIISLGGGGFESKKTREFLLHNSKVIWLNTDIKILSKRVGKALNRPMIRGDVETNIKMLLNKRIKNYQKSHLKINTDNLSINDLCDKIIKGIS
tara:strand:- start:517 stop:1041 length:525 start_codon:yes stop_codon:yes gene_type:complete